MTKGLVYEDLFAGKPLAIARAITAVENSTPAAAGIKQAIRSRLGNAVTIGITGPPGAGKSTLISALISELLGRHKNIGILAVDPSSPISGGALLGDRVRMAGHSRNPRVFIRSLASHGHLGGLAPMTGAAVDILDAAGKDVIIIETVGTGQSEVDVSDLADVKLVIYPPGLGDDMQAIKAGILEIADILVVNKADLPGADRTARQLRNMISSSQSQDKRTVMLTSALDADGVSQLVEAVEQRAADLKNRKNTCPPLRRIKRMLANHTAARVRAAVLDISHAGIQEICDQIRTRQIDLDIAADQAINVLCTADDPHPIGTAQEKSHHES